jgi:hypothetical protein
MRMGYAPKKARTGFLDWAYLMKKYKLHKEEIYACRKNQGSLRVLIQRLSKRLEYQ